MSTWGPWYRVVKSIKGHRYVYDQATRRDGRRVLTLNRYIGPLGGGAIRASQVGARAGNTTRANAAAAGGEAAPKGPRAQIEAVSVKTATRRDTAPWTPEREQQYLADVFDPGKAGSWTKPWSRRYGAKPRFAPDRRLFELTRNLGVAGVGRAFTDRQKRTGTAAQDGAWYAPRLNRVQIPDPTRFGSEGEFNRVMLHELGHVAVRRLKLEFHRTGRSGSIAYATEEICVQLAADIAAGRLGLAAGALGQSADYVQSYCKQLKTEHDACLAWAQRTALQVVAHLVAHWPQQAGAAPVTTPNANSQK